MLAVENRMSKAGGGTKRWVPLGTDCVYPPSTHKMLRALPARRAQKAIV